MGKNAQPLRRLFPRFYGAFLPEFFARPAPPNRSASCAACPMLENGRSDRAAGFWFSPRTKCCTHCPTLPNYLVGAILSSRSGRLAAGRRRIRRVIGTRQGVTPRGLMPPLRHLLLLRRAPDLFGRSEDLRCRYYDAGAGSCTLAPFWHSVCRCWFCRYDEGEDGKAFWLELRGYWADMERQLARYALSELGWDPTQIVYPDLADAELTDEDMRRDRVSVAAHRALWGEWAGREEAFYKRAYCVVRGLDGAGYERLSGVTQRVRLAAVKARYERLASAKLPDRLKRNPGLLADRAEDGSYVVAGYATYHPIRVSGRLYGLLRFFDGRTRTDRVLRAIARATGERLSARLILSLYRFRVLEEA